jgi:hypothetical protein
MTIHRNARLMLVVALQLAVPLAAAPAPQVLERAEVATDGPLTLKIARGATLELKSVVGEITIVKAKGDEVTVSITRTPAGAEPRLEMLTHDRGVTICTLYASPNPKKQNECVPGDKGQLTAGVNAKTAPSVRIRAEVPDGVHVRARLAAGNIGANAGTGDLDLMTVAGDINLHDNGSRIVEASVGSKGNLDAVLSPADARPEERFVRLKIQVGLLRVAVPTTVPIRYTISTDKPIDSSFALEAPTGAVRLGTLGPAGRPAISLTLDTGAMFGRLLLRPRAN